MGPRSPVFNNSVTWCAVQQSGGCMGFGVGTSGSSPSSNADWPGTVGKLPGILGLGSPSVKQRSLCLCDGIGE